MINWKVRVKNKTFWAALIPAVLVLAQVVLALFDLTFDITDLQEKLLAVVNAVFVLLAVLGIVADPTTKGVSDSAQALTYSQPRADEFKEVEDLTDDEIEDVQEEQ